MSRAKTVEYRAEVELTNLDQPLFDDADATKRDLVDYLDAIRDRILPGLRDRPLSVIRVRPGQPPFMQKNVPRYAPDWIRTVSVWAEASRREVRYALCNDRRTLLWFANQRAVEYHPTLMHAGQHHPTHLILDLDPPVGRRVRARRRGRAAGAAGPGRHRAGRCGEDQRGQGPARVRAAGGRPGRRGRGRGDPRAGRPGRAARPGDRDHRLHPGGPRATASSSTPPGPAGRPWSPPTARGPGPGCRCRSR